MALSFFEEVDNSNGNGERLFVKEFLEANKKENGKQFFIKELKLVKSGKGYILETDYFMVWLWKKQSITQHLLEALKLYTTEGKGYALFVVLDNKSKDGYRLAIDPEIEATWYDLGKDCFSVEAPSSTNTLNQNPFLPATYPLATRDTSEKGGGGVAAANTRKRPLPPQGSLQMPSMDG
jgi:hypothetical protein